MRSVDKEPFTSAEVPLYMMIEEIVSRYAKLIIKHVTFSHVIRLHGQVHRYSAEQHAATTYTRGTKPRTRYLPVS